MFVCESRSSHRQGEVVTKQQYHLGQQRKEEPTYLGNLKKTSEYRWMFG